MVLSGRDAAICDATLALLLEVGYDRMSMDAVAARAHASKATIYRRWPGKQELVLDAVRARGVGLDGRRGHRLASGATWWRPTARPCHGSAADDADLIAGVLRAMRTTPELADCVRTQVIESKCDVSRVLVARASRAASCPPRPTPDSGTRWPALSGSTACSLSVARWTMPSSPTSSTTSSCRCWTEAVGPQPSQETQ